MATMRDLDELALAMPEATKDVSDDGRPSYDVHGKTSCFHRRPRPDAVDEKTGERLDDVLVFPDDGRCSPERASTSRRWSRRSATKAALSTAPAQVRACVQFYADNEAEVSEYAERVAAENDRLRTAWEREQAVVR